MLFRLTRASQSTPSLPIHIEPPPYESVPRLPSANPASALVATRTTTVTTTVTTSTRVEWRPTPNTNKDLPPPPPEEHSVAVLARASLSLGASPVLERSKQIHKAKSFTRDSNATLDISQYPNDRERVQTPPPAEQPFEQQRKRSMSFSLLGGRQRSPAPTPHNAPPSPQPHPSAPQPPPPLPQTQSGLQRKSSFWSRKRTITHESNLPPPPPPPPLPPVPAPPHPLPPHLVATPAPSLSLGPFSPLGLGVGLPLESPPPQSPLRQSTAYDPAVNSLRRRSTYSSGSNSSNRISYRERERDSDASPPPPNQPQPVNSQVLLQPADQPLLSESPVSTPIEPRAPPPNNPLIALAAGGPRQRSMTNPTLLRRLSMFGGSGDRSGASSVPSTPPATDSSAFDNKPTTSRTPKPPPPPSPVQGESPEQYAERLLSVVPRSEVAHVLASSSDAFHVAALKAYMHQFEFERDPLDVALRKLLMHMALPRETQQIDRAMEAFATRYSSCNPKLFIKDDLPYILAFSLMMLHTDAFNKSNKRKMSKVDYVKNTRLDGVPPELLEYYFDNITFAPFIFIEDPLEPGGSRMIGMNGSMSSSGSSIAAPATTGSTLLLSSGSKIDPYYLITRDLLEPLRVDVASQIPLDDSVLSVHGTGAEVFGAWGARELQRAFAKASVIELEDKDTVDHRKSVMIGVGAGFQGLSIGQAVIPSSFTGPEMAQLLGDDPWPGEILTLRVAKAGVLWRKDEYMDGGRKSGSRKWREWAVVLTNSQLLFFRDLSVAEALITHAQELARAEQLPGSPQAEVITPAIDNLRPDEIISVWNTVAMTDSRYSKYPFAFRFFMPRGRQIILRGRGEADVTSWLALLNYASAFKTSGVRMRPAGLPQREAEMIGAAAAKSHLQHLHPNEHADKPAVRSWTTVGSSGSRNSAHEHGVVGRRSFSNGLTDLPLPPRPSLSLSLSYSNNRLSTTMPRTGRTKPRPSWSGGADLLDTMDNLPSPDVSDQFKMMFDDIKLGLVESSGDRPRSSRRPSTAPSPASEDTVPLPASLTTREGFIRNKVAELEGRIDQLKPTLDAELSFAHNLAVMTPFRQVTRDRILGLVATLAKRVITSRVEMARLQHHRETLLADIQDERRRWVRLRDRALQVAHAELHAYRLAVPTSPAPGNGAPSPTNSGAALQSPRSLDRLRQAGEVDARRLFVSPVTPSGSVDSHSSSGLAPSDGDAEGDASGEHESDSLGPLPGSPLNNLPSPSSPGDGSRLSVLSTGTNRSSLHEKFYTAAEFPEEAEEWDQTRAAKRVSLVRLPAETLAVIFNNHNRHTSDVVVGSSPAGTIHARGHASSSQ